MPSTPHDPLSLPVRLLAWGGLAGLAALTLVDRGATRMYATPWTWVLAATLTVPVLALVLRSFSAARPLQLPASAWLILAAATALVPVASALVSPYRGPSLLAAAIPVGAVAVFLLGHDWLAADPEARRARLSLGFALGATLVTIASTALWLGDMIRPAQGGYLKEAMLVLRNPHPLGHSNYTAGLMLLGLPWLVLAARCAAGAKRIAWAIITALALFNLFNSGSRGGLLGLAALGVAAVATARLGWKKFLLLGTGAVVATAILAIANPRIRALLGPTDPAAEPNLSNVQRTAMLRAGLLMGHDRLLLGWGPGTTPLAYPRYRDTLEGGAENVLQLHSLPVQLWAETGATGLLVALAFAGLAWANRSRSRVAAVTLAGYGVFALTDHQLDVPVFSEAVALALAMLAPPAAAPAASRLRGSVVFAALAGVVVIAGLGRRDPTPRLNAEALELAKVPAQHDRAVALLQESLRLNPDQEIAHFNLGWLLLVPDPSAAERHFLAAANLVPDKGGVYFGLGLARLNQGDRAGAARALALECINEPLFLASPWWNVPAIAAEREATQREFDALLASVEAHRHPGYNVWWENRVPDMRRLAPHLGQPSPGPEKNYRRERLGYPVLMRDLDLPPPLDLYDVREDPRFPESVSFPLPSKGWMPSPKLLKLLHAPR